MVPGVTNPGTVMYVGKTLFVQIMDFVPWTSFRRIVARYGGDQRVRTLNCADQFRVQSTLRPPPPRGKVRYPTLWCRCGRLQDSATRVKIAERPLGPALEVTVMHQVVLQGQEEALRGGIAMRVADVICAGPHARDSNEITVTVRSIEPAESRRLTSAKIVKSR